MACIRPIGICVDSMDVPGIDCERIFFFFVDRADGRTANTFHGTRATCQRTRRKAPISMMAAPFEKRRKSELDTKKGKRKKGIGKTRAATDDDVDDDDDDPCKFIRRRYSA